MDGLSGLFLHGGVYSVAFFGMMGWRRGIGLRRTNSSRCITWELKRWCISGLYDYNRWHFCYYGLLFKVIISGVAAHLSAWASRGC